MKEGLREDRYHLEDDMMKKRWHDKEMIKLSNSDFSFSGRLFLSVMILAIVCGTEGSVRSKLCGHKREPLDHNPPNPTPDTDVLT